MIDNTTAAAVINHMGTSHSDPLNKLTKEIWLWCIPRNIWLSAAHIAGKCNIQADLEFRHSVTETEWMLKGQCHEDFAVLGQFCAEILSSRL